MDLYRNILLYNLDYGATACSSCSHKNQAEDNETHCWHLHEQEGGKLHCRSDHLSRSNRREPIQQLFRSLTYKAFISELHWIQVKSTHHKTNLYQYRLITFSWHSPLSRSTSSNTMRGLFPPSSIETGCKKATKVVSLTLFDEEEKIKNIAANFKNLNYLHQLSSSCHDLASRGKTSSKSNLPRNNDFCILSSKNSEAHTLN